MYHNIDCESGFNTVSVRNLREQLEYLRNKFNIVSIDEYTEDFKEGDVVISVDDAYKSFREYFYPILYELKIPAIIFVPVDHIGKYNSWDKERRIEIMNLKELREISRSKLVTIGSHGLSHERFSKLTQGQIENELIESKKLLENELGIEIRNFSYPFGQLNDIGEITEDILKRTGYRTACTTRHGIQNSPQTKYNLYRIEAEPYDTIESFRKKCENKFHYKLIKRWVKEILIKSGLKK
jgi:peptidoglycan/xylan/chitin deacetylase (PgdA/CDA1 family)